MDKSRQYIQMCKTSKEIQTTWQQKTGDFFVDITNRVSCWTENTSKPFQIKKGFRIRSDNSIITIEKFFWLPRLNQLIEIAQSKKSFRDTSFDFFEWSKKSYLPGTKSAEVIFGSIEQLWLAYVMERMFSKKWAEGMWVDKTGGHSDRL